MDGGRGRWGGTVGGDGATSFILFSYSAASMTSGACLGRLIQFALAGSPRYCLRGGPRGRRKHPCEAVSVGRLLTHCWDFDSAPNRSPGAHRGHLGTCFVLLRVRLTSYEKTQPTQVTSPMKTKTKSDFSVPYLITPKLNAYSSIKLVHR